MSLHSCLLCYYTIHIIRPKKAFSSGEGGPLAVDEEKKTNLLLKMLSSSVSLRLPPSPLEKAF